MWNPKHGTVAVAALLAGAIALGACGSDNAGSPRADAAQSEAIEAAPVSDIDADASSTPDAPTALDSVAPATEAPAPAPTVEEPAAEAPGTEPTWPAVQPGWEHGKEQAVVYLDVRYWGDYPEFEDPVTKFEQTRQWRADALGGTEVKDIHRPTLDRLESLGYVTTLADGASPIWQGEINGCDHGAHAQLGYADDAFLTGVALPFGSDADAAAFAELWGDGANTAKPTTYCLD